MDRKAFLDQKPPPGYVAGIGRGATGFVTGGDTGALQTLKQFDDLDNDDDNNLNDNEERGLLASKKEKDDDEAERIYDEIEQKLSNRNKRKLALEHLEDDEKSKQLEERFSDLKNGLSIVTKDDWVNLPEAIDLTRRNKRTRLLEQLRQRFYATPDNLIASQAGMAGGKNPDKDNNQTVDDLINNDDIELDNQMADIEINRDILSTLRKAEPLKPSSWIASARLEVQARKFKQARKLIDEGCRRIPKSEAIWLESIKIHQNSPGGADMVKSIVTEALRSNSGSEELWIKAFECETGVSQKVKVLMQGISFIPDSVKLWERMIELQENEEEVKKMLLKVTELCPQEWQFWLSLINLLTYEEAKSIINKARKLMKSNHHLWITAVKLEERENENVSDQKLIKMLQKAIKQLNDDPGDGKILTRRDWLDEATKAEREKYPLTCKAIVVSTIDLESPSDAGDEAILADYFSEADHYINQKSFGTANYIYEYAVNKYPHDITIWMKFFNIFKNSVNFKVHDIYKFYEQAIKLNPEVEVFHLMYAKDKWKIEGNVEGAREILSNALKLHPNKEDVWFAIIKFEVKNKSYDKARVLSDDMIRSIHDSSSRVWYKHIHLQRFLHKLNPVNEYESFILKLTDNAISEFPDEEKFYLQKGQILIEDLNKLEQSREVFTIGTNKFPHCINLWLSLTMVDEKLNIIIRARSILDRALIKHPDNDRLLVEKVELERRANNIIAARQSCSKALAISNKSPYIWMEHITLIPQIKQRKNAFMDALKATDNSPLILLNIGIYFWVDGKIPKAKAWFERAISNDNCNGDIWGWLFNFYSQHGTEEELTQFRKDFTKNEDLINKGEVWNQISKLVENLDKSQFEILDIVSKQLRQDTII